jgi:hypothetical protein
MNQFININNDKKNERCLVLIYGKCFRKQKTYDDILTYVLKIISDAILISQVEYHQETIDISVNLDGLSLNQFDMSFAKNIFIMLQNVFPNRLNKCYIYYAPSFFRIFYNSISPIINKHIQSKIKFEDSFKELSV